MVSLKRQKLARPRRIHSPWRQRVQDEVASMHRADALECYLNRKRKEGC